MMTGSLAGDAPRENNNSEEVRSLLQETKSFGNQ